MSVTEMFAELQHPQDPTYLIKRQRALQELYGMNVEHLRQQLHYQMAQKAAPRDASGDMTKRVISDIYNAPFVPQSIKSILDSTNTTTGNVLIRQDLEPVWAFGA